MCRSNKIIRVLDEKCKDKSEPINKNMEHIVTDMLSRMCLRDLSVATSLIYVYL